MSPSLLLGLLLVQSVGDLEEAPPLLRVVKLEGRGQKDRRLDRPLRELRVVAVAERESLRIEFLLLAAVMTLHVTDSSCAPGPGASLVP